MALFKIHKGDTANLDAQSRVEGYCWFTPDTGHFFIDTADARVPINATMYGVCNTAAATATKTVDITGFRLYTGARVTVKFTYASGAANSTLNVNGTGAKNMVRYGTTAIGNSSTLGWAAGAIQTFTYDGTSWVADYWQNTTYSNVALGQGYATCSTAAATAAKTASLSSYALTKGGIVAVKFTYAVPANATLNINSKGAKNIYYRGAKIVAGIIDAGDTAIFMYDGTQYQFLAKDYNNATTTTAGLMSAADKAKLDGIASGATANTGDITGVTAGVGLAGGATSGSATVKAKLRSETALTIDSAAATTTTGRVYPVAVDKTGYLSVNVPWTDTNTNTTYSAGTGLSLNGTTFNHSNSITAGSVGSAQSPSHGGTFAIPKITYDAQGHITGATTVNITLPADNNTDTKVTQTARTTDGQFPILVRGTSAGTSDTTTTTSFRTNTSINLSTGLITEAGVQMQRKYGTLIPYGTNIPANANLNTTAYLKVGNYYQGANATVATFTNCPTTNAFMMQVLSPLSTTIDNETTGTWVYRLRILQTYTGPRYVQYVYSGATAGSFTYGDWYRTVECEADGAVGSTTTPIYLNNGRATAGSSYAKAIVGISRSGTTFTYTCIDGTTGTFTQQDNDTHYTANLYLGGSTATSNATTAVSNPYLILRENSTNRNTVQLKSGGNISISGVNGVVTFTVPTASGTVAGVTVVYPAASCTTFSSDSGTVTPLAVQKGAKMFAITRPDSSTVNAITRFSNTTGDVKDSKIIIEDVTNTRDTTKKAQVIAVPAEGGKKMVYGYCTDQVDGTSFIGGVFDASATSYPYSEGLAIGGTSGNLLWKGKRVLTTDDTYSVATTSANGLMSKEDKLKLDNTNVAYGTCATAAETAAKVVTLSGNTQWKLANGAIIMVKFTNTNSASSVTLNVNNTGAYPIWYSNAAYTGAGTAYTGYAGRTITYMFNGTHWVWVSGSYDANTQSNTNSTNTSSKIYLVGATSQGSNKTTYSHDTVYVGTDGHLYSNSQKVLNVTNCGDYCLPLSGGTMTGNITMGQYKISLGAKTVLDGGAEQLTCSTACFIPNGWAFFSIRSDDQSTVRSSWQITDDNQLLFRAYRTTDTSKYESYYLPTPAATGDSAHYGILTAKGGATSGLLYSSSNVALTSTGFRNIKVITPGTAITVGETAIPTGEIWVQYEE